MRKDYKQMKTENMMRGFSKRGQVAIYVIVALVIVAVIIALFVYPRVKTQIIDDVSSNPQSYLSSCLSPVIKESIAQRAIHGGDVNPEGFVLFRDTKIKYLCYSSEYYKTCVVQEPLIKERMEDKVSEDIKVEARKCIDLMIDAYEGQGYKVSGSNTDVNVEINPDKISVIVESPMTITKDSSRTYESFSFEFPSKYYEILYIASSIVDYESTFGNSETTSYLQYYSDISIDKNQLSDGTRIYKITNTLTNEEFQFASRSLAWPPGGYGGI